MNIISIALKHYIIDMGLSIMFDNIKTNMHVSKPRNAGFVDDRDFPFKCEVLIRNESIKSEAYWENNILCIGCDGDSYKFKYECGIIFNTPIDDVIKIIVLDNFGDNEGWEYNNENWIATYYDKDGNLRYLDNDELVGK